MAEGTVTARENGGKDQGKQAMEVKFGHSPEQERYSEANTETARKDRSG